MPDVPDVTVRDVGVVADIDVYTHFLVMVGWLIG